MTGLISQAITTNPTCQPPRNSAAFIGGAPLTNTKLAAPRLNQALAFVPPTNRAADTTLRKGMRNPLLSLRTSLPRLQASPDASTPGGMESGSLQGTHQASTNSPTELKTDSKTLFSENGVFDANAAIPEHLNLYIEQCDDVMEKVRGKVANGEMSPQQAKNFQAFLVKIGKAVMNHPIIAKNAYLERFRQGVTPAQARNELQQFSVFAFQFNVSLAKMIANADSLEEWETYTTILANEMGAPFAQGFDGELKGTFSLKHNHHNWLFDNAKDLGMSFKDIGGLDVAHSGTKAFVKAIDRYYTSPDRNVRGGAAFAIENWAAAKFWPLWLEGVKTMNKSLPAQDRVGLSYIKYHDTEERHHSKETIDELLEAFTTEGFEPNTFLNSAVTMLNEGVQAYYESQLASTPEKDESWPASILQK